MNRQVFLISDGTGITISSLAQSLLSQFDDIHFKLTNIPFVNTEEKAHLCIDRITLACHKDKQVPIIFTTIVNENILNIIKIINSVRLDCIQTFIDPLEKTLGVKSSHTMGRAHGMHDYENYKRRMNAVNFSLNADDGACVSQYGQSELILVGVSRCGKTPTSLFLALNNGVSVANYPITEEDIDTFELPKPLRAHKDKLFGLTINVERLMAIRAERKPNSRYASRHQCEKEVRAVEKLYRQERIPWIDSTNRSVEELATKILTKLEESYFN